MGFLDELDKMDLADDVKERLIQEHRGEVDPLKQQNDSFSARSRRESVEAEVTTINAMFGDDGAPGLAKFVRRILLSADAEEPGAVLLSDNEMGLSGDTVTGATGREEISISQAVRGIFERMPKAEDGRIALSDQAIANDDEGRPNSGNDDDKAEEHKKNLRSITGRTVDRTRKRYGRASITAGEEV